jgi:ribosomal protein S18 acetylase RimI-like enzyme
MTVEDTLAVSRVHAEAFPRQTLSDLWITCNFNAFPRIRLFIAEIDKEIVGYIQWTEKSGFRKEVILELEQIAVLPSYQSQGFGTALISRSLPLLQDELEKRQAHIKHILVSTRTDNKSQKLYSKTLHASPEAIIRNLFSADEVLMISRNFGIGNSPSSMNDQGNAKR